MEIPGRCRDLARALRRGPLPPVERTVAALTGMSDPRHPFRALRGVFPYSLNMWQFARRGRAAPPSLRLDIRRLYPCLVDRFRSAGTVSTHYFHQDLWAARRIHDAAPPEHYDVGSRIDGFVAHLLSFREVNVLDYRPLRSSPSGLHFLRADVVRLPFSDESVHSLSCLHAMEHVGLGRYGDAVDPNGCFHGMRELQRVLAPGGSLYFSVPIGRERVEFDAHRVFSPDTVLRAFDSLRLVEFSAVGDDAGYVENADPASYSSAHYACGLFRFERPETS